MAQEIIVVQRANHKFTTVEAVLKGVTDLIL